MFSSFPSPLLLKNNLKKFFKVSGVFVAVVLCYFVLSYFVLGQTHPLSEPTPHKRCETSQRHGAHRAGVGRLVL